VNSAEILREVKYGLFWLRNGIACGVLLVGKNTRLVKNWRDIITERDYSGSKWRSYTHAGCRLPTL
jgi:hypothetical protein